MSEGLELLERLRRLLGLGSNGRSAPRPPRPPHGDGPPPGCEDAAEIPCEEAAKRVYEYLDGELDPQDAETIRCHVEQCRRCYPMYNWEQLFLDVLKERGDRPEPSDELRRKVAELLDREAG
jgi:anti-sigma factor (TIGR02949 family)